MKRIHFFATPSDIIPVLKKFESNSPLKYVQMGSFPSPDRGIYFESTQIPNPGIATHETGSISQGYIVSLRDTKNRMRSFVGKNGENRWTLDNCDNEETVILKLAGLWKTGTLLPGSISTLHTKIAAQQLMKWFLTALKQEEFTKARGWWLGHEAKIMLMSGKRLATTAEQSPSEYDLKS